MKREEGFLKSFDGTELHYTAWIKPSSASVILIHGYGDHAARYEDLIGELSHLPISWFAYDLRGQGRSGGLRVYAEHFDDFVRDSECFVEFISNRFQDNSKKLILFGHSLGGLIAVRLNQKRSERFSSLILTSPCFQTAGISWSVPVRWVARFLNWIWPHLILTNFVVPKFLFRNPDKMRQYVSDPLIERRVSGRLGFEIIRACEGAAHSEFEWPKPLMVLASGDDRIVSLDATKNWFRRAKSPLKELKVYPQLYHEIFNELDHQEPLADLTRFLMKQVEV